MLNKNLDISSSESIEAYAKQLEGMTFREVLELGIWPDGETQRDYNNKRYKGGMGTLIEERFFGYKANSDQEADFAEAGVELKATCYDRLKDGTPSAGERLVLTMIPLDRPIEPTLYESHVWAKSEKILLIYYERDREKDGYDQIIRHVQIFTPPEEDLKIIEDDYAIIADIVESGRAETLSESLTTYLGACTKGASAATMWVNQYYPPHTPAKKRAFCFKRSYMDYVLHTEIIGDRAKEEPIVKYPSQLVEQNFDSLVLNKIFKYKGKTDFEICAELGILQKRNKAFWHTLIYRLLGIRGAHAEEFEKANISVRTVRVEEKGGIRESLSLHPFKFKEIAEQEWEESFLYNYFESTRFLFVTFVAQGDDYVLKSAKFWSMPMADIEGPLRDCWERTKKAIVEGVEFKVKIGTNCGCYVSNNFPKISDKGGIAHVRPHAKKSAYKLSDGTNIGNIERDGDELPDGQFMTKQSFWLNSDYVYEIVKFDDPHFDEF